MCMCVCPCKLVGGLNQESEDGYCIHGREATLPRERHVSRSIERNNTAASHRVSDSRLVIRNLFYFICYFKVVSFKTFTFKMLGNICKIGLHWQFFFFFFGHYNDVSPQCDVKSALYVLTYPKSDLL